MNTSGERTTSGREEDSTSPERAPNPMNTSGERTTSGREEDSTSPESKKDSDKEKHELVEVINLEEVDREKFLKNLIDHTSTNYEKWKRRTCILKSGNMVITIVVVLFQAAQVIFIQVPSLRNDEIGQVVATIIPIVSGAILSIQLKLAWSEKGTKAKKVARMYSKLNNDVLWRRELLDAGGKTEAEDIEKLWNKLMQNTKDEDLGFISCF